MTEEKLFQELNTIKRLLGAIAIKDKSFREQVKLLTDAGLQPSEIADITGKSSNFVNVTKHSLKKKKEKQDGQ
jgi:hypothetical protein